MSQAATEVAYVRDPLDFFPTPPWVTRAILHELPPAATVLDPCAGDGQLLDTLCEHGRGGPLATIAYELDPARAAICTKKGYVGATAVERDAIDGEEWVHAGLIVTNPPYTKALEFVATALEQRAQGGTVAMLLRVDWLGSQARARFHRAQPADIFILPTRPCFVKGATGQDNYAWFLWGPGRGGHWRVLPDQEDRPGRRNKKNGGKKA